MNKILSAISWLFYRISGLFFKIAWAIEKLVKKLSFTKDEWLQFQNFQEWYAIDGDANYRIEYELNPDSVVLDVGGYRGVWAKEIFSIAGSRIFIYEPIEEYYIYLTKFFRANPKIKIYPFGLGGTSSKVIFSKANESSSSVQKINQYSQSQEECVIRKFSEVYDEIGCPLIDVLKINIEGGEYDLLLHIVEEGLINKIRNIQIQFHINLPDYELKIDKVRSALSKTHYCTWHYEFVWENWVLKS
jgi:FkbM family methyltransferase